MRDNRENLFSTDFVIPRGDSLTLLSHPRALHCKNPFKIFNVFAIQVWALIFLSLVSFGLINFTIKIIQSQNLKGRQMFDLFNNCLDAFTMFMGQTLHNWRYCRNNKNMKSKYGISVQILTASLAMWVFCSFLLRHLLSLDTLSAILSGSLEKVDTFNQVIAKLHYENYYIIVNRESGTELLAKMVRICENNKFFKISF